MGRVTTVKLMKKTRERLAEIGSKKETYDDVINRLIEFFEKNSSHLAREDHEDVRVRQS